MINIIIEACHPHKIEENKSHIEHYNKLQLEYFARKGKDVSGFIKDFDRANELRQKKPCFRTT